MPRKGPRKELSLRLFQRRLRSRLSALSLKMRGKRWEQRHGRLLFNMWFLVKDHFFFYIILNYFVCAHVWARARILVHALLGLVLPFCHMHPKVRTQVIRPGSRSFTCWAISLTSEEWLGKRIELKEVRFPLNLRYRCADVPGKLWTHIVETKALTRGRLYAS